MDWQLPGTTLSIPRETADYIEERFRAMFCAGGMVLSQVAGVSGVEAHTIQNWVKRGFLPPPQGKRYNMEQVCRIININILKGNMPIEMIIKLMGHLNGNLADESDDLVDDTLLFFLFVKLAARARYIGGTMDWDEAIRDVTQASYRETIPGAREKLQKVLKIMLTVWVANILRQNAENQIAQL